MRYIKFSAAIATLFCLSTFAAVGAYAQTWDFTGTNASGALPCSAAAPCGQVSIDVNSAGTAATFTVTSLLNNYVFDSFGFNAVAGGSILPLTLGSSSGEVSGATLGGSGNEDGWGKFDYNFQTGVSGGSKGGNCTVTGGSASAGCTFSFTVDGTGLTLADFEVASSGGNGSGLFAGHAASPSQSGYEGSPQAVTVPEGSSIPMLGACGLALLGSMAMKRRLGAFQSFL
jgi:hypothetical protein